MRKKTANQRRAKKTSQSDVRRTLVYLVFLLLVPHFELRFRTRKLLFGVVVLGVGPGSDVLLVLGCVEAVGEEAFLQLGEVERLWESSERHGQETLGVLDRHPASPETQHLRSIRDELLGGIDALLSEPPKK